MDMENDNTKEKTLPFFFKDDKTYVQQDNDLPNVFIDMEEKRTVLFDPYCGAYEYKITNNCHDFEEFVLIANFKRTFRGLFDDKNNSKDLIHRTDYKKPIDATISIMRCIVDSAKKLINEFLDCFEKVLERKIKRTKLGICRNYGDYIFSDSRNMPYYDNMFIFIWLKEKRIKIIAPPFAVTGTLLEGNKIEFDAHTSPITFEQFKCEVEIFPDLYKDMKNFFDDTEVVANFMRIVLCSIVQ